MRRAPGHGLHTHVDARVLALELWHHLGNDFAFGTLSDHRVDTPFGDLLGVATGADRGHRHDAGIPKGLDEPLSRRLEAWLEEQPGFTNFVRRARLEFGRVDYAVVSALGSAPEGNRQAISVSPRGVLLPLLQDPQRFVGIAVRAPNAMTLTPQIRATVAALNADIPIYRVDPMAAVIERYPRGGVFPCFPAVTGIRETLSRCPVRAVHFR